MNTPTLRHVGNNTWLMDTTVSVRGNELPVTLVPSRQELALWFALHPEDDPASSVYHDVHCVRCAVCRECMDCNLRPCIGGAEHVAQEAA